MIVMNMKNILVITGSPRDGNSEKIADSFIDGALSAGNEVNKFRAGRKDVKGCVACDTCWSKGRACSMDDDFIELEPMLESADVIVFVSPLYYFTFSSQLKSVIDKLHAYSSKKARPLRIKESVLIMCGATDDLNDFAGAMATYDNIIKFKGWKDAGGLMVPCVEGKDDVAATGALEAAKELGSSI